jgi:hypothetical protein
LFLLGTVLTVGELVTTARVDSKSFLLGIPHFTNYPLVLAFGNYPNITLQVTTIKPCIPVDINTHKQYQ